MKTRYAELSCLALALAICNPAQAVSPQTAEAVVSVLKRAPQPTRSSTDFEKWSYDTLSFTASSCWHSAHPSGPVPDALRGPVHRGGSFSLPTDEQLERLCASLATEGFRPWCESVSVTGDRKSPDRTLPRDYLQFERYTDRPAVSGGLYCHVSKDSITRQFFVPDQFSARWLGPPVPQRFNLQRQERVLRANSVILEVPSARGHGGGPFQQPVTGIVPD